MYSIIEKVSAQRALRRMQPKMAARIREKIRIIADNPYGQHNEVTKLQGREGYRLRVGDWRVLYTVENDELVIYVVDVLPRGSAYTP